MTAEKCRGENYVFIINIPFVFIVIINRQKWEDVTQLFNNMVLLTPNIYANFFQLKNFEILK